MNAQAPFPSGVLGMMHKVRFKGEKWTLRSDRVGFPKRVKGVSVLRELPPPRLPGRKKALGASQGPFGH